MSYRVRKALHPARFSACSRTVLEMQPQPVAVFVSARIVALTVYMWAQL